MRQVMGKIRENMHTLGNGFWNLIGKVFGELSETTKKDVKSAVIIFQFLVIAFLGWQIMDVNQKRVMDKDEVIERLLNRIEPRIERKVDKKVEAKTKEMTNAVEQMGSSVKELTQTVRTKVDSMVNN